MSKNKPKKFFAALLKNLSVSKAKILIRKPFSFLKKQITSWPRLSLWLFGTLIVLYYPLGAFMTNSIDTDTSFETPATDSQSATVSTAAYLIRREINNKIWTPNLPFFFPASILDNMPAFQSGLMSSLANVIITMNKRIPIEKDSSLHTAAELLNYPPTIWMFSPQNKLLPAPSSNSQYRRARKHLLKYNEALASGETVFLKRPQDLLYILRRIEQDIQKGTLTIEAHVREYSDSLIDNRADDLFFYQQGKLYGYHLMLKALSADYKEIIVSSGLYEPWTRLLKTLENASRISPLIIRNGAPSSSWAPNHLIALGYYASRAAASLLEICPKLEQRPQ